MERIIFAESVKRPAFAVIGGGNGGQAMAGFLALRGFPVNLWNRSADKIRLLNEVGGIALEGEVNGFSRPDLITGNLKEAVSDAKVIMVAVPALAHGSIAREISPWLSDGQIIVLNPGRTGGALEFRQVLRNTGCKADVTMAEAGTFVYASRTIDNIRSHIYGIKKKVTVAALPATRTMEVVRVLRHAYPQFVPVENVLVTSFDNIGAIFHPIPTILNAGRIESGEKFEHYRDGITPSVAKLLEQLDAERIAIAEAYGVPARTALEWMRETYAVKANTLYEAVQLNPGYHGITAANSLNTRYIFEDVPYGLVPLASLARLAGVKVPLMRSTVTIARMIHGNNYWLNGRRARNMGISGMTVEQVRRLVMEGVAT